MHNIQKRSLSMFRRVRELLTTDTIDPTIAAPLAELDAVITRLSEHGITQDTLGRRTRSFTVNIGEHARSLRRDLMRPAFLAARTVYPTLGNGATALRTILRMPRRSDDYEALIVAARAFANAVDEHAAAFAAAGLPENFAGRMRTAADALLTTIDTRAKEEQRRIAATRGLAAESRRGTAFVRLLDSLVEPALRSDPARQAEWQKATRVRSFTIATPASPSSSESSTATSPPSPVADSEAQKRAA